MMQPSETKVLKFFLKVGPLVPNDGSSTMFRPRLEPTQRIKIEFEQRKDLHNVLNHIEHELQMQNMLLP